MDNLIIFISVPVIVVFTKSEALELVAIEILQEKKQLSFDDAAKGAADYAKEHLQNAHLKLEKYRYHPQGHVYLRGKISNKCVKWRLMVLVELNKLEMDCEDLVKCTAAVLDGDRLQTIFISTQQNSLEVQMEWCTRLVVVSCHCVPV